MITLDLIWPNSPPQSRRPEEGKREDDLTAVVRDRLAKGDRLRISQLSRNRPPALAMQTVPLTDHMVDVRPIEEELPQPVPSPLKPVDAPPFCLSLGSRRCPDRPGG